MSYQNLFGKNSDSDLGHQPSTKSRWVFLSCTHMKLSNNLLIHTGVNYHRETHLASTLT